ncbi:MAG: hypothetical protein AMXMBFR53_21590 [Gemmatimonadota bacterium]
MNPRIRTVLAVATVGSVGGVALVAAALNPPGARSWLLVCAVVATAMAAQAVTSEPRDLIPALVLGLLPVAGLASAGTAAWLAAPFAVLLLLAGELSVLTWEDPARLWEDGSLVVRLREAGILGALGLGVAIVVGALGAVDLPGGTWAVVAGSVGLMGVAALVFSLPSDGPSASLRPPVGGKEQPPST